MNTAKSRRFPYTQLGEPMQITEADVLPEIVRCLVEEFDPEKIILFGSRAWGQPGPESDYDLFVVVAESKEHPAQRAYRAHHCLGEVPVSKDVLVKTRAEVDRFSGVYASLEAEVLERGKVLYERGQARVGSQLASQGIA
jgi:uncharacterized protein